MIAAEIEPIERIIRPSANVIFDVGGNVGVWSVALLELVGNKVRELHIFEPSPLAMAQLEEMKASCFYDAPHLKVICVNSALGERQGTGVLHFNEHQLGFSTLHGTKVQLPERSVDLVGAVEVPIISMDDYCQQKRIDWIDYVKIDTEGSEMSVLAGSKQLFENNRIGAVCFEFGLNHIALRQYFCDFWEYFNQFKYKLYFMPRGERGYGLIEIPSYATQWEKFDVNRYFVAIRATQ
jgi:FkbM family methyltransferase